MKLGSLKEGGRDGTLIVVSRDLARAVRATGIAPTLQRALEDWSNAAPRLNALYEDAQCRHRRRRVRPRRAGAGRAAAARLRIRRRQRLPAARGARAPRARRRGAGELLHRSADVPGGQRRLPRPARPGQGGRARTTASTSRPRSSSSPTTCRWRSRRSRPPRHIQLVGLVNDVSLRNLIPAELAKGFGFLQSKPRSRAGAGVRDAGRAGRGLAGQQAAPAAAHPRQRRVVRRAGSRRGHAVRLRPAGGARGQDPPAVGRHHRRLRHRGQRGHRAGRVLLRRAAHRRNPARRQAAARRSCRSATPCASRCWIAKAAASSARSSSASSNSRCPEAHGRTAEVAAPAVLRRAAAALRWRA